MKPVGHYTIDDVIGIGLQPRWFYKENILTMYYAIDEKIKESEMFESTELLDTAYNTITTKEVPLDKHI